MGSVTPAQQSQTTNTNQQTGPSEVIAPYLMNLTNQAYDWSQNNQTPPSWMSTVAPESQRTIDSRNLLYNTAQGYLNNTPDSGSAQGRQFALDTLSGKYLDAKSNPAYQGWLEASFRPQAEQFRDVLAPGIDAKFSGAGRPGSGAHFDTTMRGVQDLERSQSDAAAKAALGYYQGERANQFSAANLLPMLQNMDLRAQQAGYQNIAAMQAAAQQGDAYAQRVLDDAVAQHRYEATAQPDWYTQMAQRLQAMYPGGASSGNAQSWGSSTPARNETAETIGTVMAIAGTAGKLAAGFSDERLKDVHARVGFTDDGIPLFLYNYKGLKEPRIGPMAQDVAKVKPEAVARHSSGYLAVDYAQLAPQGGLF